MTRRKSPPAESVEELIPTVEIEQPQSPQREPPVHLQLTENAFVAGELGKAGAVYGFSKSEAERRVASQRYWKAL